MRKFTYEKLINDFVKSMPSETIISTGQFIVYVVEKVGIRIGPRRAAAYLDGSNVCISLPFGGSIRRKWVKRKKFSEEYERVVLYENFVDMSLSEIDLRIKELSNIMMNVEITHNPKKGKFQVSGGWIDLLFYFGLLGYPDVLEFTTNPYRATWLV